jgi:hypothetical protein
LALTVAREADHETINVPGAGKRGDFLELGAVDFYGTIRDGDADFRISLSDANALRADIKGD